MNNEQSNYPCKFCWHFQEVHYNYTETAGGWEYLDDIGEEVWHEELYHRSVCDICQNDCIFEQMNNLEYLEWKYDESKFK